MIPSFYFKVGLPRSVGEKGIKQRRKKISKQRFLPHLSPSTPFYPTWCCEHLSHQIFPAGVPGRECHLSNVSATHNPPPSPSIDPPTPYSTTTSCKLVKGINAVCHANKMKPYIRFSLIALLSTLTVGVPQSHI